MVKRTREDLLKQAIVEAAKWQRIYRSQNEWNDVKREAAGVLEYWTDRLAYLESLVSGWGPRSA